MAESSILGAPEALMFDCYFLESGLVYKMVDLCRRFLAEIHFSYLGEELDVGCVVYVRD